MIKCYGPSFAAKSDENPHSSKAHTFKSIKQATEQYEEFCLDCKKFGLEEPADYYIYFGEPVGNEEAIGYPKNCGVILKNKTTKE